MIKNCKVAILYCQENDDIKQIIDMFKDNNFEVDCYYYPADSWSRSDLEIEYKDLEPFYDIIMEVNKDGCRVNP